MTAPVGIRRLLSGGGDCLTLRLLLKSWVAASVTASLLIVTMGSLLGNEGDRRCLWRYDAELIDLGSDCRATDDRGRSSWYDEVRLTDGLVVRDDAGDCCEGGV